MYVKQNRLFFNVFFLQTTIKDAHTMEHSTQHQDTKENISDLDMPFILMGLYNTRDISSFKNHYTILC